MTLAELDRDRGIALWRQVAEALEQAIVAGHHAPGERLPTEHALARHFGVNRHTVRRALAHLAERGLVRVEQGRGTFVQDAVIDYAIGRRTRFSENIAAQRLSPGSEIVRADEVSAEAAVARALEIRKGSSVILLETLGRADERPLCVASHYFPRRRFPAIIAAYEETGSVTRALARLGVADYTRKVTRVTARPVRAADARLLRQPPNRPILMSESIDVDADGRPILYTVTRFASDRVQMVFEPGV